MSRLSTDHPVSIGRKTDSDRVRDADWEAEGNSRARESPFLGRLSQQSLSSLCWVPVPEEKAYLEQNR